jgi:hypothetical protein
VGIGIHGPPAGCAHLHIELLDLIYYMNDFWEQHIGPLDPPELTCAVVEAVKALLQG